MRGLGGFALAIAVVLLLRSTALAAFAARGLTLDVLVFATLIWSLRHGAAWGASFGFAVGLLADLDSAHWLGRHALALTLMGYGVGRLSGSLVRESVRTQLALVWCATAAHQAWTVAFELGGWASGPYLIARVLLSATATALIGVAVLAVARRLRGQPLFGHVSSHSGKTL